MSRVRRARLAASRRWMLGLCVDVDVTAIRKHVAEGMSDGAQNTPSVNTHAQLHRKSPHPLDSACT
eukprot:2061738-Alexandrium_andersonii.AAC.1